MGLPASCISSEFSLRLHRHGRTGGILPFLTLGMMAYILLLMPLQVQAEPIADDQTRLDRHLFLVSKKITYLQNEISELMNKPPSRDVLDRISNLQKQVDRLKFEFESLGTKLPMDDPALSGKKGSDWMKQIEELTLPLLQAIRDLTEKPRRIDALKKKIEALETQQALFQKATRNLDSLEESIDPSTLPEGIERDRFLSQIKNLKAKYDPELVKFNLERARQSLSEILSSDDSLVETATDRIMTFFKTRGRNLLVTIATFAGLWWVLTRIRKWVVGKKFFDAIAPEFNKLFSAAYNIFVLVFCFLVSLACLYAFNDWLLISLLAMAVILAAWTSRQYLPKFIQEIKLIVNLGTVREGERLVWQGIPWLVKDIALYSTLVNEQLEGGEIKLPVGELIGKHSRPVVENESWFPTRTGDWVILSDGTYGQVKTQTMEQVVLKLKGQETKYFSTTDFMARSPLNISHGFRYSIEFGLDYGVQEKVCDEIPDLFEKALRERLSSHFAGESPDFNYLEVRFDHASDSSLNLMVIIHVEGRCADQYEEYRRKIQATLVRICNENNLVIPFNRLTINLAKEESDKPKIPFGFQNVPTEEGA